MSSLGNIPADIRVPLVYIDIDNSQALDSAPAQSRKIIVIGQQSATGTAAVLTQNRITSDGTADQLYGKGSMLAGMLKTLRKANSYTEVWAMGLADIAAGAAAKAELAITGPATAAGTLALLINGILVQVGVSADDTADTIATAIIAAVNKLPDTQVIAALKTASTTSVTLTTNWKGATGNAMDVRLNYYTGEQNPAGVAVAITAFNGGTGTPDIAAVVAALGDDWYTDIVFPFNDTQSLNTIRDELLERWGPL
ncbi:TPA: phage tail protein, partial [Klebsiella quasipneumoniae]|nr:phage tail protein [Klebsiella quasipneumoniae]